MTAVELSASDIAAQLRAVASDTTRTQATLARHYAEYIELRHDPHSASDGSIPAKTLVEIAQREMAAVARSLPGPVERDSEITVEGDNIRVRGHTRGTLSDGSLVDVRSDTLFGVRDGTIVSLTSNMDRQSMEAWGNVLRAGGFELPTSGRAQ